MCSSLRRTFLLCAATFATLTGLLCERVFAQPVLINCPTTVGPTDATIVDCATGLLVSLSTAQITVRGTTLTINGRHVIASLSLERSLPSTPPTPITPAILTHDPNFSYEYSDGVTNGMNLTVTDSVFIQGTSGGVASRIDVSGQGFPGGAGLGAGQNGTSSQTNGAGGGHGGEGGVRHGIVGSGGQPYGSLLEPTTPGSGGGVQYNQDPTNAGRGGGVLRLSVSGTLTIDGSIRSDGTSGGTNGGGAGGSIWITASSLAGSGLVTANGGTASSSAGTAAGAGSGGRIAVQSHTVPTSMLFSAASNGGAYPGAAGTIRQYTTESQTGRIIVDNGGLSFTSFAATVLPSITYDELIIRNSGVVAHPAGESQILTLSVLGNASILTGGRIDVTGRGYPGGVGPGAGQNGTSSQTNGAGGGHGGEGGVRHGIVGSGGQPYGSLLEPTTPGSGGGVQYNQDPANAGRGGGVVRMIINGILTIDGSIRSNGTSGGTNGGGAGGSIWITASSLAGSGLVTANGGTASSSAGTAAGAGSGGRIAVQSPTVPTSMFFGAGSNGGVYAGAAGTIRQYTTPSQTGRIIVDNGGLNFTTFAATILPSTIMYDELIIRNNGVIAHPAGDIESLTLRVLGNASILSGGRIDVTGRGYAGGTGPGAGQNGTSGQTNAAGGGHGGEGGVRHGIVGSGGRPYGSLLNPSTPGSGGGVQYNQDPTTAGRGGGVLRLIVDGTLTIAGSIRSDGTSPSTISGGGAGGSIWITAASLMGSGLITANGGATSGSAGTAAGAGSGGRIAVQSPTVPASMLFSAASNGGVYAGAAGTIRQYATPSQTGRIIVDNSGLSFAAFAATILPSTIAYDELTIRNNGVVAHPAGDAERLLLNVLGNTSILTGGRIDVTGRGYAGGAGPGAGQNGTSSQTNGAGGGHGGVGGVRHGIVGSGGQPYGSLVTPITPGSGGGVQYNQDPATAGRGGGVVRLIVNGLLTIDGSIKSDGTSPSNISGGGAGGSIWITAASLTGSGLVTANGGAASSGAGTAAGGGSGGRIAVESCTITTPASRFIVDGGTAIYRGSNGTFSSRRPSACPCSADFNHDGDIGTDQDIEAFFRCLAGTCCPACDTADFNNDGDIGTDQDIEAFFRVLAGGNC